MRSMHIDNVDLNLLKALDVLLEERHISRAAERFHLSQSAMSRTLDRLRRAVGDELLVRQPGGWELTLRARAIQRELEFLMPRIHALVNGGDFDPATSTDRIRLNCTDYASTVLGPNVFQRLFREAPAISLTVEPLSPRTFEDVDHGRVDLAFSPVKPPAPLRWHPLFEEEFVCVLSSDHPVGDEELSLEQIAHYPQVTVVVLQPDSMIIDRRMSELGIRSETGLRVPYFTAAVAALPGTTLIAVLPRRLAERYRNDPSVRIAAAPKEFVPFTYGMSWHPRLDGDRVHSWVRELVIDAAIDLLAEADLATEIQDPDGDEKE
jgi:DNA-binding transcriptional LysR family regulator